MVSWANHRFDLPLSISGAKANAGLRLHPNPAYNHLTIELPTALPAGHQAHIYNNQGKKIYTQPLSGTETQILTADLPPGMDLLQVNNERVRFAKQENLCCKT